MTAKSMPTLEVRSRAQWRDWLREHHASEPVVWLVFRKGNAAKGSLLYEEAIEEALCHGWVDSIVKRLDDERYARKFTPRKPDSKWSTLNRRRYEDLKARGLLAPPGVVRAPTKQSRSGDAPRPSLSAIPSYIEDELKSHGKAWECFERLAPSCRRQYIGWIDSAKREETRAKRLREAVGMLAAGKKLGLK